MTSVFANKSTGEVNGATVPKIGVSACLLGHNVRYDGVHKFERALVAYFEHRAQLIPVCPEVEMGLAVPREALQLERFSRASGEDVRMIAPGSGTDRTGQIADFNEEKLAALQKMNISGFIFQQKSPSCGLSQVKLFTPGVEQPSREGIGLFAAALTKQFPHLPVTESRHLQTQEQRNLFWNQVLAY